MLVKLLKNVDYYEAGTLCGWPDEKAKELVARGLAVIVEPVAAQELAPVVSRAMPSPVAATPAPTPKAKAKKA